MIEAKSNGQNVSMYLYIFYTNINKTYTIEVFITQNTNNYLRQAECGGDTQFPILNKQDYGIKFNIIMICLQTKTLPRRSKDV